MKKPGVIDTDFCDIVLDLVPSDPSDAAHLMRDGKMDGTSLSLPIWFINVIYLYGFTAPPWMEWLIYVTSRAELWRLSGTLIAHSRSRRF